MIAVLSPAKTLDFSPCEVATTQPRLLERSAELVNKLSKQSTASLQEMMHISEKLAKLNRDRFKAFHTPFTTDNAKPSILAFKGDVYLGLEADDFDCDDLQFAQNHLRILSGLYGVLRPLDLMQAYRLEMGTKLKIRRKKNLYEFWNHQLTELLNSDLETTGASHLINLASQEYFKSLQPESLLRPVVNVHFKEDRKGKLTVIAFNAKKARGRMARLMIKERMTDPGQLKALDIHGYQFQDNLSSEADFYFTK